LVLIADDYNCFGNSENVIWLQQTSFSRYGFLREYLK